MNGYCEGCIHLNKNLYCKAYQEKIELLNVENCKRKRKIPSRKDRRKGIFKKEGIFR